MKKAIALIVALLLVISLSTFVLTGCNHDDDDIILEGDGDIQRDADGNIIYNNVKLSMWSVTTGDDANTQDDIIARFNDMYKGMINVEVRHITRYDLETLLSNTMQFDKENAPDMLFNHGSRTAEYVDNNWIQQVDFFFEKSGAVFDKSDFVDSLLESVTVGNTAYGVPIDCHSAILCMRKDILDKNNLPIPTNYTELVDVCDRAAKLAAENNLWIRGENSENYGSTEWRKASTAEAYTAFPISFGDMWVHEFVDYTAAVQNGGKIVDSNGMPGWNTQETANGLQVLRDWIFPSATSTNKYAMSKNTALLTTLAILLSKKARASSNCKVRGRGKKNCQRSTHCLQKTGALPILSPALFPECLQKTPPRNMQTV